MLELPQVSKTDLHNQIDHGDQRVATEVQQDIVETSVTVNENTLSVLGALIFFSVIGLLVRIGINRAESYTGQPAPIPTYSQFIGCLIIGYLLEHKLRIEAHAHTLYVGLSTGLCGSITTFSGVMLASTQQLFNITQVNRNVIQDILAGLGVYLATFSASYLGFVLGRHIAVLTLPKRWARKKSIHQLKYADPQWFSKLSNHDYLFVSLGLISLIATIPIVAAVSSERNITFSMIFAPIGTIIRWRFGRLNSKRSAFPVGTFISNILASYVLGSVYIIARSLSLSDVTCSILWGLMDGFCGCLSTISTWVVELSGLKIKNAYFYGAMSIVIAQVGLVIIFSIYIGVGSPYSKGCI